MQRLFDAAHRFAHLMHLISGVLLVLMVVTVLVDVTTRFLFGVTDGGLDLTFRGGVEIVSYSLLFMVLFALPHSVDRGQVVVDLFTEKFQERTKQIMEGVFTLGFALLGVGMATRFYEAVHMAQMTGETTQDLLIPLYYFYGIAAFATAALSVRSLIVALEQFFNSGKQS